MKYDFDLENRKEERKKLLIKIAITLGEVIAVVLVAFFITRFGMVTYKISGQNMSPTLKHGDEILVNKISYKIHSIKRNDVILVRQGSEEHQYYTVVRVIGLPGETVQIKDGMVYVDDEKLSEKCKFPEMENGGLALEPVTVEEDEYFVLCDNRNNVEDSRNATIGNIMKEDIIGKAWIRMNTIELVSYIDEFENKKSEESAKTDTNNKN